ncbi:RING finger protein [Endozoicomonas sp. 8E]|uniref:RING finger protein n=1 Tax=Endozoicomonas sp. 8E TaxID=3035692 RepID=UPI0029394E48|nr:RING finger protein [Endozoicomonas sp. 8E]WOG29222.1 RING finger protein [Endozoicomonas sp. 8E]
MTIECALKTLLFSVFLFFYQQVLADDTYGLEEFRRYHKANSNPPLNEQQRHAGQSPLENIRIGFVGLNLTSDDLSGDERFEISTNYEVDEQDFRRLISFYFRYVNMTHAQYDRKNRIQRMLRLIHYMFAININQTYVQSPDKKALIKAIAQSLFEHFFSSVMRGGWRNPYFHYFSSDWGASQSNYVGLNNNLVLMLLAFLGPHFLSSDDFNHYFTVLRNSYIRMRNSYTGICYNRSFFLGWLSENINEYSSTQSIASQFVTAGFDTEIALLIGLTAMASAAFQSINSGREWPETLETLLQRYLPYEIMGTIYWSLAGFFPPGHLYPVPRVMFTVKGMQEFTEAILGIDPTPESAVPQAESSQNLGYLSDYFRGSDNGREFEVEFGASGEDSNSEHQDPATVIQQQNELIAQLRRQLASQTLTEEAGAVGGAPGGTAKCPVCFEPPHEMTALEPCGHAGLCKTCAERFVREQRGCPICRKITHSYRNIYFVPHH